MKTSQVLRVLQLLTDIMWCWKAYLYVLYGNIWQSKVETKLTDMFQQVFCSQHGYARQRPFETWIHPFFSPQDAFHSGNVSQSSRFVVVKKVFVWFFSRGSLLSCKYLGTFYWHRRRRIPVKVYTVTGSLREHNVSQPLLGSKDFVDANGSTEDQAGATFTVYFCCFSLAILILDCFFALLLPLFLVHL